MIRPYLAIVKDAFRATIASRVLYVMIGLILLVLAALAPLHLRETLDWELSPWGLEPVANAVVTELVEKKDQPRQSVVARIWERLPEASRTKYLEAAEKAKADPTLISPDPDNESNLGQEPNNGPPPKGRRGRPRQTIDGSDLSRTLATDLNNLMRDRQFYDPEVWKTQVLRSEAQELVNEGVDKLTDVRVARLNRLLLNNALKSLPIPGKSSAKLYYAVWHLSFIPSEVTRSQMIQPISGVLRFILDKFVLSLGILIAIIITANMIPETFEPGSLNLLLSKPIHRPGLLISKFFGGTTFVALCGLILFAGIYLWMGLGLGLWDRATLFSIPLYILVFAIYFSVSVFVGLLYRSAIVSVVLTIVFWAICFAIGTTNNFLASGAENQQLSWGREIGNQAFAMNKFAEIFELKDQTWTPVSRNGMSVSAEDQMGLAIAKNMANFPPSSLAEPIIDPASGRILIAFSNPLGLPGIPSSQIAISNASRNLFVDYLLPDSLAIFSSEQGPLLVSSGGRITRLDLAQIGGNTAAAAAGRPRIPDEALIPLGPNRRIDLRDANRVSYNPARNEFAMISSNTLYVLGWQDGNYRLLREVEVESGAERRDMSALVAYSQGHIVVAFGNARVLVFEADSLRQVALFQPESRSPPTMVRADPVSGEIGILYRNGRLWLWQPSDPQALNLAKVPRQGTISGFSYQNGQMTLCHSIDRLSTVSASGSIETTYAPQGTLLLNAYRYVLKPLYNIFPKPGEFYRLVDYLSSSRDTRYDANVDLRELDEHKDPWSPLRSGLYFMVLMLALSCFFFSRLDC